MANLGNLWFGADIDLTNLKQKIQQGNKDVLDALKLSYDPSSYQEMVNKLRSELGKEEFGVKLRINTSSANGLLSNVSGGKGAAGIDDIRKKIMDAETAVNYFKRGLEEAKIAYAKFGGTSRKNTVLEWRKDLAEATQTLKNLQAESRALNGTMRAMSSSTTKAAEAARQLNSDSIRLNATLAGGVHISTKLGSALSGVFAVHAARQFLQTVIEIGGQLEKQRVSIGAILGDTAKANQLFEQIKNLALRSPFGVVELDQYTKQLAAYGFQQSELFDMTKRLADISAGAGTDISRLANALGHVRSATYLTGITLRQFSMNNIPMLKMLADYYSEVEHRAVSTAEVTKRISAKQVSYEDVIEQIKRLTDEGGMFYNMQEKIADTLAAKWKNLHDAMDIMYGELAESAIGDGLKGLAQILTELTRKWREISAVLTTGAIVFNLWRGATIAVNAATRTLTTSYGLLAAKSSIMTAAELDNLVVKKKITKEMLLNAVATKRLTPAMAELAATNFEVTRSQLEMVAANPKYVKALTSNKIATSRLSVQQLRLIAIMRSTGTAFNKFTVGWKLGWFSIKTAAVSAIGAIGSALKAIGWIAAIEALVWAWTQIGENAAKAEERVKALREEAEEGFKNLQDASLKFKVGASAELDNTAMRLAYDEMIESIKNYSPQAGKTLKEVFKIDPETGLSVHSVAEQYELLAKEIETARDAEKELVKIVEIFNDANDDTGGFWKGNEKFDTNVSDYADALRDLEKSESKVLSKHIEVASALAVVRRHYADFNKAIEENVALYERSNGKEGFATNDMKAQIRILEDYAVAYLNATDNYDENVRNGYSAWREFANLVGSEVKDLNDELIDYNDAQKTMMKDAQSYAEGVINRLKGVWGANVEGWSAAQKRAVQMGIRSFLDGIKGFKDMAKEERQNIEELLLAPMGIKVDADIEDAYESLTELQSYLQTITTRDWVVNVKTATDITGVIEDVEKSIKEISGNMPKLMGAIEKGGFDEKKLKELGQAAYRAGLLGQNMVETDSERHIRQATKDIDDYINSVDGANAEQKDAARKMVEYYKQMENNNAFKESGFVLDEGKKKNGSQKDEALEAAKTRFDELKSFLDEYKKYREVYGEEKSIGLLEEMFPTTKGRGNAIVENFKGVLASIKNSIPADSEARKKFGISIDKYMADFDLNEAKRVVDDALKEMQEYVSKSSDRYNLYKSLFEKTGKRGFADAAFIDGRVWDDVAREFDRKLKEVVGGADIDYGMTDAAAQRLYEGNKEAYELWKKIVEITRKNYTDALTKGADALAKEYTIEEKILAAEERIAELKKERNSTTDANARNAMDAQIHSEEDGLERLRWEAFEHSADYVNFFGATLALTNDEVQSIGQAIKQGLNTALRTGAISAKDYAKTMKEVNERMNESATAWRGDFGTFLQGGQKGLVDKRQDVLSKASNELQKAEEERRRLIREGYSEEEAYIKSNMAAAEQYVRNALKALHLSEEQYNSLVKMANVLSVITGVFDGLQHAAQSLSEMYAALGNDEMANKFSDIADGIGAVSSVFAPANNLINNAMNGNVSGLVSGAISAPVDMFTGPITAFAKLHDKKIQREIEASQARQKEMERLTSNLQRVLSNTLGGVYNMRVAAEKLATLNDNMQSYYRDDTRSAIEKANGSKTFYDTSYASMLAQRDELRHQMDEESSKKDSDASAIADYKQALEELDVSIANFAQDMAKSLYDIDIKGWAAQLGDALFEAWQKGEDGAEAFKKKASEIIADVAKNIAVTKLIETAMQPVLDTVVSEMERTNGMLDEITIEKLSTEMDALGKTLPFAFNNLMEGLNDGMKSAGLTDMKKLADKTETKSSTSSSIKGVSEETADILASYVNAMRADLAVIRGEQIVYLPLLYEVCTQGNVLSEQQVLLQGQIADNTAKNVEFVGLIYDLLHGNVIGANSFSIG